MRTSNVLEKQNGDTRFWHEVDRLNVHSNDKRWCCVVFHHPGLLSRAQSAAVWTGAGASLFRGGPGSRAEPAGERGPSVCVKQPLKAIGGRGGEDGLFVLAAVQHSTCLCDIQCCDLRKPAAVRNTARPSSLPLPQCVSFLCNRPQARPLPHSTPSAHLAV